MIRKPILCVDFDGVIHSYTSPWTGEADIPDPPVRGALEWLARAIDHFTVVIYSSRSKTHPGRQAMFEYIRGHADKAFGPDHVLSDQRGGDYPLSFSAIKPPAFLTLDDRALQFQGDFSAEELDPANLLKFKPWNRR